MYGSRVPEFPYRSTGKQAVTALVEVVRGDPDFVAGCLVCGGAHGYVIEIEYVQRRDGTIRYRVWDDVNAQASTEERPSLVFDVAGTLERVRAEGLANRKLPDDAPVSGRRSFITFANRDGGFWVEAPTPLRGAPREGALAAVFNVVFPP
jgi:hypothetical protein